ncbi:hypothetical protein DDE19_30465 [Micromonospora ureilytica]|uniref:Uncharacterized protein n=1 Tax=Micromonospora ureilytica TaxID=709868 RepID=A0A3N9XF32_9ACTN|nr:hypothetical protein DDE19_30465 [Micromonospora ureilytica]
MVGTSGREQCDGSRASQRATEDHGSAGWKAGGSTGRGDGTVVPVAQRRGGAREARPLAASTRGSRSDSAARIGSAPAAMVP